MFQGYNKIKELKQQLSSRINLKDVIFEYNGKIMHDYKSLDYYHIEDEDIIKAVYVGERVYAGPPIVNNTYSSNINCQDKRGKIGEFYGYHIKGSNEGSVWGDGVYTDDSNIAKAAVLEGKCQLGEEKTICIRIVEGKSSYSSCSKNGISSSSWGQWGGSYIFNKSQILYKKLSNKKLI